VADVKPLNEKASLVRVRVFSYQTVGVTFRLGAPAGYPKGENRPGEPLRTVFEFLLEKKLIPGPQELLVSYHRLGDNR